MQYVLTVQCPDRKGIVHAVSGALLDVGGNIVENAQFELRAVKLWAENRIFAVGNKTVVFH